MPLPWQHSFCHCRKMCIAHLHSKANISAKFHENWSKNWGSSSRRKIGDRPPDRIGRPTARPDWRPTARRHADSYIPPLYTTCMRGYNNIAWWTDSQKTYIACLLKTWMWHRGCSQRNESRSESHFGSRSASWLGSWFELRAFTSIANAVSITNRICALQGNILFLLRSPCWLTHAWLLQCAFPKCARTNHVPKELCIHMSWESGFLRQSRSKTPLFFAFQKPDLKELSVHKG